MSERVNTESQPHETPNIFSNMTKDKYLSEAQLKGFEKYKVSWNVLTGMKSGMLATTCGR